MGLIVLVAFIAIYVCQFNYYKKKELSYTCLIIELFLLIIQSVLIMEDTDIISEELLRRANENFISFMIYYFVYYCFLGFAALLILWIPIYKYEHIPTNISLVDYYVDMLKTKNSCCSRSDYWFFYAICLITGGLLGGIFGALQIDENNNIRSLITLVLQILNLIFQAKRLNDIAISKWFLLIYLVAILGSSFSFVVSIVMLAIMCLPSQQIPTTDIKRTNYTKEK